MNKIFFLIALLYCIPIFSDRQNAKMGMAIDFPGLSALDHTGMIHIGNIDDFRTKTEHMINHKLDKVNAMPDYVLLEQQGQLTPEFTERVINYYTQHFLKISQKYFKEIRHLKPILMKLISTWAQQRGLQDSLVLLWAGIEPGKEEQFVKDYAPTIKSFYTFLGDIDMLLLDIMHSCPKTYAHYLECKKLIEEKHQQHA
jgi:hypothetical protein